MVDNTSSDPILFNRLGGEPTIAKMSDQFVTKFKEDPNCMNLLKDKEEGLLTEQWKRFFTMITGGAEYDRSAVTDLLKVNKGDVDPSEDTYDFIVDFFEDIIKEMGFNEADQKELMDVFADKRNDICGL